MIDLRLAWRVPLLALLLGFTGASPSPLSPGGEQLKAYLASLHVEKLWLSHRRVEWRTGEPVGKPVADHEAHSHCSAFAAAACDRLGIYLLHPPEHPSHLLANAQYDWLKEKGPAHGWKPVETAQEAQRLANQGTIVVAVCQGTSPTKHGHIALFHPSSSGEAEITQAGLENYAAAPLHEGFKHHPVALRENGVRFFAHAHSWP